MTEVQHLQKVLLMIIKDIDDLCKKNDIEYYLLGGSCIGAIRHKGFIPWDDDLDICMTRDNYERFINVCRNQLDGSRYILQEGLRDWPLYFSKIRLRGTHLHEPEDEYASEELHGIYIDVFCLENISNNNLQATIQYFLAKLFLCYQLSCRRYQSASFTKKLLMVLASPLKIKYLRQAVKKYIESFNSKDTIRVGLLYGRTRLKNAFIPRRMYGQPKYVPFEDTVLPVPELFDEYLTIMFGDYMTLPPEEQRKGQHLISVDFGGY